MCLCLHACAMCAHVGMHVRVCSCASAHACMCVRMYLCVHVYVPVCAGMCTCLCAHVWVCGHAMCNVSVCVHVNRCVSMCACSWAYACTCAHVCALCIGVCSRLVSTYVCLRVRNLVGFGSILDFKVRKKNPLNHSGSTLFCLFGSVSFGFNRTVLALSLYILTCYTRLMSESASGWTHLWAGTAIGQCSTSQQRYLIPKRVIIFNAATSIQI